VSEPVAWHELEPGEPEPQSWTARVVGPDGRTVAYSTAPVQLESVADPEA